MVRQSTVIFGTLLFAFLVYITVRGQLPAYMALFSSKPSTGTTSTAAANANPVTPNVPISGASDFAKRAATFVKGLF